MATNYIPEGYHTVTPYLVVDDIEKVIEFLEKGLGGQLKYGMPGPDGKVRHAEVLIGNSHIMLGQSHKESPSNESMLYLYVPDVDATFAKALAAGASEVMPVSDQFYGDRSGGLMGPCGNQYWIATHKEDVSEEEMARRMAEMG